MSKGDLRQRILSSAKPKSQVLEFFGQQIELRQPSLRVVMGYQTLENKAEMAARMLINYAYDPEDGTRIFEDEDLESVMDLPFGDDMNRVNVSISELTGIKVEEEAKNSDASPSATT